MIFDVLQNDEIFMDCDTMEQVLYFLFLVPIPTEFVLKSKNQQYLQLGCWLGPFSKSSKQKAKLCPQTKASPNLK